ncbi:MAG: ribonuclease P protein component 4 [Thermoplasmata archaeon]
MKPAGRRGRRTGAMVRIAHGRVDDLFALAAREAAGAHPELSNRYVVLARKVGTRYNVRLRPEYRELYCRGCSTYWVEGRTVRTRLRSGKRVRTCLACGRERRTMIRRAPRADGPLPEVRPGPLRRAEGAVVLAAAEEEEGDEESEDE